MPMWDAKRVSGDEHKRIEDRAAADARMCAKRIWQDGLPGGKLEPVAVQATYDFIARLKQDSAGIPRWAWYSQEAQRQYIQDIGDRYYFAFLHVLGVTIGRAIPLFRAIPKSTPLPAHFPDLVTPLVDEYSQYGDEMETDSRDWSGTHPTEGAS